MRHESGVALALAQAIDLVALGHRALAVARGGQYRFVPAEWVVGERLFALGHLARLEPPRGRAVVRHALGGAHHHGRDRSGLQRLEVAELEEHLLAAVVCVHAQRRVDAVRAALVVKRGDLLPVRGAADDEDAHVEAHPDGALLRAGQAGGAAVLEGVRALVRQHLLIAGVELARRVAKEAPLRVDSTPHGCRRLLHGVHHVAHAVVRRILKADDGMVVTKSLGVVHLARQLERVGDDHVRAHALEGDAAHLHRLAARARVLASPAVVQQKVSLHRRAREVVPAHGGALLDLVRGIALVEHVDVHRVVVREGRLLRLAVAIPGLVEALPLGHVVEERLQLVKARQAAAAARCGDEVEARSLEDVGHHVLEGERASRDGDQAEGRHQQQVALAVVAHAHVAVHVERDEGRAR